MLAVLLGNKAESGQLRDRIVSIHSSLIWIERNLTGEMCWTGDTGNPAFIIPLSILIWPMPSVLNQEALLFLNLHFDNSSTNETLYA